MTLFSKHTTPFLTALLVGGLSVHCSGKQDVDDGSDGGADSDSDSDSDADEDSDGIGSGGTGGGGNGSGGDEAGTGGAPPMRRACDGTPPVGLKLTLINDAVVAPISVVSDPNDATKLYATEKMGNVVRLVAAVPEMPPEPAIPASTIVLTTINVNANNEGGVLSMAFHPDFGASENRVFVSYSAPDNSNEIQAYSLVGDVMTALGEPLYSSPHTNENHYGGDIAFGPDGYLYLSIGDGGNQSDGDGNAQDLTNAMGSIVRIDVDNPNTPPAGNISTDNGQDGNILHYGFRNPWRISFDRGNNDLFIADVGQGNWEEVSVIPMGTPSSNFGWPRYEGTNLCGSCSNNLPPEGVELVFPVYEHDHSDGNNAITGGYVYRGTKIPSLVGRYILADSGPGNNIYTFTYDGTQGCDVFELTDALDPDGVIDRIASFGQDADGELYIASISNSRIFRIDPE